MNILLDSLPRDVSIGGLNIPINSDFRTGILFSLLMEDSEVIDSEKIFLAIDLYFEDLPKDLDMKEIIDVIIWFYRCDKPVKNDIISDEENEDNTGDSASISNPILSYEYDADYIYSAFLSQYNIDLQDVEYMHWWKFKALLQGLSEDHLISKNMGYRAMIIDSDMSQKEKAFYREKKRIFALPDMRTDEEKEADFNNSLGSLF